MGRGVSLRWQRVVGLLVTGHFRISGVGADKNRETCSHVTWTLVEPLTLFRSAGVATFTAHIPWHVFDVIPGDLCSSIILAAIASGVKVPSSVLPFILWTCGEQRQRQKGLPCVHVLVRARACGSAYECMRVCVGAGRKKERDKGVTRTEKGEESV